MQIISRLKNKNVLVATAIGALLGLVAGAKGEGNLFFSVLFGVAVGAFVGSLGGSASPEELSAEDKDKDKNT